MWGPAPAITPSTNKLAPNNNNVSKAAAADSNTAAAAKKKKKKGKKVDSSILGFTVRPVRVDGGEGETVEK